MSIPFTNSPLDAYRGGHFDKKVQEIIDKDTMKYVATIKECNTPLKTYKPIVINENLIITVIDTTHQRPKEGDVLELNIK